VCSSLPESSYLRIHNLLAKIILQQIAIKYKLLDRNTRPYCRYKPQPVLESANTVLYWDRYIITDTTVDFSRTDTVPIEWENKTALVTDTAVPLTHT
jgi:hypothetical protein